MQRTLGRPGQLGCLRAPAGRSQPKSGEGSAAIPAFADACAGPLAENELKTEPQSCRANTSKQGGA